MAHRILTKQTTEIDDTREYSDDGYSKQKKTLVLCCCFCG